MKNINYIIQSSLLSSRDVYEYLDRYVDVILHIHGQGLDDIELIIDHLSLDYLNINQYLNQYFYAVSTFDGDRILASVSELFSTSQKIGRPYIFVEELSPTNSIIRHDSRKWSFLHWASNKGEKTIIKTTIEALKYKPESLERVLMAKDFLGHTFLHTASIEGDSHIIKTTIDALKDEPEMLQNLLMVSNYEGNTFLHSAAKIGESDIIKTIIDALKDDHKNILQKLLMAGNTDKGKTFLYGAALLGYSEIIDVTINALKDDHKNMLQKLLISKNDDESTFLHEAAYNGKSDIIASTINALKDNPDILTMLLNSVNKKGERVIDMVPNIDYFIKYKVTIIHDIN